MSSAASFRGKHMNSGKNCALSGFIGLIERRILCCLVPFPYLDLVLLFCSKRAALLRSGIPIRPCVSRVSRVFLVSRFFLVFHIFRVSLVIRVSHAVCVFRFFRFSLAVCVFRFFRFSLAVCIFRVIRVSHDICVFRVCHPRPPCQTDKNGSEPEPGL